METISRIEAIEAVGIEAVERVERERCEPTTRARGEHERGWREFSASVDAADADGACMLTIYYDVPVHEVWAAGDDLSTIDWKNRITGYSVG